MKNYAGDLDPIAAWEMLQSDANAVLIDVRTDVEWQFVGLPDLTSLNKPIYAIAWQIYPGMMQNSDFAEQLARNGIKPEQNLLFLCRSGARSAAAAAHMSAQGYKKCWNISGGFEGPLDSKKHRGTAGGWKAEGLPWRQS